MKTLFKKLLLSALLAVGFHHFSQAQYIVNGKEIDTTFNHQINYVFGNLDKSRVPYGLLKDYALELTNLLGYNGTDMADSTLMNKSILYEIYNTLATSRVTADAYTTLPNPSITDSLWYSYRQPGQVTLCGLFYQYAYFDANALNNNTITVSNNQYFDKYIDGVWQNPYLTGRSLGFAPATANYMGQTFNIVLPSSLWLSNSKNIVDHIEVDAADGQGYRTITPDIPLPVAYADTGIKIWNFKLYLTDNTVLQSHTRLQVNADVYGQNIVNNEYRSLSRAKSRPISNTAALPSTVTSGFYPFESSESYLGKTALGYVTVQLAPGHSTIQKPLIIVEGFDAGKYLAPETPTGSSSLRAFILDVEQIPTLNNLLVSSYSQQYDLIYIDYADGTDYIQRNALLVKDVIRWVNSVKQPIGGNPTEKNVVLGQSMGTLVARYALKKMEDASETHDVRLYISHDGPQQGANVPVGLQYLVNHAHSLYARAGVGVLLYEFVLLFTGGDNALPGDFAIRNTPAARQMLTNYIDVNGSLNTSEHDSWQTELDGLGYPAQGNIRKVAISNGSECAKPADVATSGQIALIDGQFKTSLATEIISTIATVLFPVTTAEVYGGIALATGQPSLLLGLLPGANKISLHFEVNPADTYGGNQAYHGYMNYTKKLFWVLPFTVSMTNVAKNAPSGFFFDKFPGSFVDVGPITGPADSNFFYNYHITVQGPTNFCFIPTVSALDVGSAPANVSASDYLVSYGADAPPSAPKSIPFDNFITARDQSGNPNNEGHISFEPRNGNWLANELSAPQTIPAGYNTVSCTFLCQDNQITGTDLTCGTNSSTFSVLNSPSISYSWSVPSTFQIISGQGTNSIQLQLNGSGPAGSDQISCQMSSAACGSITVTRNVFYGTPTQPYLSGFDENGTYSPGYYLDVSAYSSGVNVGYNWSVSGGTLITGQGESAATILIDYSATSLDLAVYAILPNGCTSLPYYAHANVGYGRGNNFSYYPNPANNSLTISTENTNASNANSSTASKTSAVNTKKPFSYKLYDNKGKILLQGNSSGEDLNLDVRNIASDTYFLHVLIDKKELIKQIIIQH